MTSEAKRHPLYSLVYFYAVCFSIFFVRDVLAQGIIRAIEIRGNKKIERAAIILKIKSQVGIVSEGELVREDIRSIFSLGFFESIDVYEEDFEDGVRLVYELKEKPTLSKIEYVGLNSIEQDDLKDIVSVKEYEVVDIHKLNQSVEKLTAKYEEKGFYLADVRYEIGPVGKKNDVKVTFHIEENDKIQVKRINIIGNTVIPDDELKDIMQTKEGGAFSWLTGSGSYREAIFERDVAAMQFYYGTKGYVRARFGKPEVSVSADKKFIFITFSVEEGVQYFVGKLDFSGELLFPREQLLEDIQLIEGEVFNTELLRRETLRYTEKYGDLGFAFANVVPQPAIHDESRKVDVTFEVDKGERVFIGEITITGNMRTKDKVIRRELKIHEGELFSGTRKRESRENVLRLGFFENVDFHQVTNKHNPSVVDIEIKVKERSTGQLVIGAGFISGDNGGFTAQAQLSQNNFLGNGQVASFSANVLTGKKFYEYNLSFQEPYVGYSNWSLGGDLYHLNRTIAGPKRVPTFDEMKTGISFKMGHPVLEFTHLYLTYKLENSYVNEASIIDRSLIDPETVNGMTSSIAGSIIYDKRDDRFEPRKGLFGSLSTEYAGLGGDRNYFKTRGTGRFFHPIIWDFIFRLNISGANISSLGGKEVPINELFIQGGLHSLRGYSFFSVGPKRVLNRDPTVLSSKALEAGLQNERTEIVVGGHSEVLLNAEIEFPILREARIKGVFFFDTGNAFDGFFDNTSPKLLANFGWGIRWFTPIGPLRFEFGYPIVNSGSPEFYFTIGPAF